MIVSSRRTRPTLSRSRAPARKPAPTRSPPSTQCSACGSTRAGGARSSGPKRRTVGSRDPPDRGAHHLSVRASGEHSHHRAGGITNAQDALEFLMAGASSVQVGRPRSPTHWRLSSHRRPCRLRQEQGLHRSGRDWRRTPAARRRMTEPIEVPLNIGPSRHSHRRACEHARCGMRSRSRARLRT